MWAHRKPSWVTGFCRLAVMTKASLHCSLTANTQVGSLLACKLFQSKFDEQCNVSYFRIMQQPHAVGCS